MSAMDLAMQRTATLSPDGVYRYDLTRTWGYGPTVLFVMLNPSTADAEQDDPTIRRCIGFARTWGCKRLAVVNQYALRTTRPVHLREHPDPVGSLNHLYVTMWAYLSDLVVAAWGAHDIGGGSVHSLVRVCQTRGVDLRCLGTTKDGHPRHPLYVRADTRPVPWTPAMVTDKQGRSVA